MTLVFFFGLVGVVFYTFSERKVLVSFESGQVIFCPIYQWETGQKLIQNNGPNMSKSPVRFFVHMNLVPSREFIPESLSRDPSESSYFSMLLLPTSVSSYRVLFPTVPFRTLYPSVHPHSSIYIYIETARLFFLWVPSQRLFPDCFSRS